MTTAFLLLRPGHPSAGAGTAANAPASAPGSTGPSSPTAPDADGRITGSPSTRVATLSTAPRSASSAAAPPSPPTESAAIEWTAAAPQPGSISAYRVTMTYTKYQHPKGQGGPPSAGDVVQMLYPCTAGVCAFYAGEPDATTTFAAGAPLISGHFLAVDPATGPTPCDVAWTWRVVLAEDGSYTGTVDYVPRKAVEADYGGGHCATFAATSRIVLVPVTG
jgi:hypothetical protein